MNRKQRIARLQIEKKELEIILGKISLCDSDTKSFIYKDRQIDSLLDEMISINEKIDKMEHQSDIVFDQSMLSRFMKFPGVDNIDNDEILSWWMSRY